MGLNKTRGNMYSFVSHTWNPIKGRCGHNCSYCYMKRWGAQKPVHLDGKELRTKLGNDNYIFVGSSCDMFAGNVPDDWIRRILARTADFEKNKYLFQSKNPMRFLDFSEWLPPERTVLGTTIETNKYWTATGNAPAPFSRSMAIRFLHDKGYQTMITIEPIMDFDLPQFVNMIETAKPTQVNIGADSRHSNLIEPSKEKVLELIFRLGLFTIVHQKNTLKRLVK